MNKLIKIIAGLSILSIMYIAESFAMYNYRPDRPLTDGERRELMRREELFAREMNTRRAEDYIFETNAKRRREGLPELTQDEEDIIYELRATDREKPM